MKPEELYQKEFGEADSIPKESVIRLLRNFAKVLEIERNLVNQEVERRIAERMPSPSDKLKGLREYQFSIRGRHEKDYITEDFLEGVEWLRSRLTTQVTPQDTHQVQKEGGGE